MRIKFLVIVMFLIFSYFTSPYLTDLLGISISTVVMSLGMVFVVKLLSDK